MNRRNKAIVDEEVEFSDNEELVSTTDKRGVITYVNEEFCRVSGYETHELLNKNHNMIRHPDMPKAAFKDLWEHLKNGQAWRGAVKNRCKDGRYYWVDAFVTPIFENNILVGYQSVRRKLAPEVKNRAINLYSVSSKARSLTSSILVTTKHRIIMLFFVTLCAVIMGFYVSPLATLIVPFATISVLYHELFIRQKFYDELKQSYDSISRLVFCDDKTNYAEYHLKMQQGRVQTILGRTLDSSSNLLKQVHSLENVSDNAHHNIEKETVEIENIASAVEQMVATIGEVSRNSASTLDQVLSANTTCQDANSLSKKTQNQVSTLVDDVSASYESAENLSQKLTSITSIMSEIQGIAEQTNLLALNAAIESARAGEYGRGFSVVADEVRALSQRTQKATSDIQQSMGSVLESVAELSETMKQGKNSAQICIEFTSDTQRKIEEMASVMQHIEAAATQISTATEEQSVVASDINQNIVTIRDASQCNLKEVDEVTELTRHIKGKAQQLASLGLSFQK
ncbi:methyl-accepting chemotaxis protein [Vibrio genomosp. F6]|uniref:Chemotaxis protein n=1 Tax=Vibrio genomosp. F6 str. FF-238 TaxID=1191298 RepID=A0A1E5D4M8_9VIBR|nr:PAS domain-containing methyl-accepting chemotaxis protein [Vibrio genomosp. F6]OEE78549.1 chemotaxis protein [Vibrio genomosp. F6 str. FF-238]TKF21783.1 methyl-accepting chemotaxis protein [Vibrio genomosp. F6]